MNLRHLLRATLPFALWHALPAQAVVACSLTANNVVSVYDALATSDNLNSSTFTLSCTRDSSDPSTLNFISFTNDGLYNNGLNNRAKHGSANSYVKYDFFTSSGYSTNWSKSNKCIVSTLNFGGSLSGSATVTFYARIPTAQTGIPQGQYTDLVTVSASYNRTSCQNNATADTSGAFSVQISNVPACQFTSPPGTMAFTYAAFSTTAATASTTFGTRCSTTLPYTMALDATSGVVSGLRYTLTLSGTSGTGNGAIQSYSISGSMPAGQAGTCTGATCNESVVRSLTITY